MYNLREFKLTNMSLHSSILIIGKRATGKTFLVKNILHRYNNLIPNGLVIVPSEIFEPAYKDFIPESCIFNNLNEDILENLLLRQSLLIAKDNKNINSSAYLVLDNCLSRKSDYHKKNLKEILLHGGLYNLTTILTVSTPLSLISENKFDYVFLLREDSLINKNKLWNEYGSMFPTFEMFNEMFMRCTEDYGAMVIDNTCSSSTISQKFFHFKASDIDFIFNGNTDNVDNDEYEFKYFINEDKLVADVVISKESISKTDQNDDFLHNYFVKQDKFHHSTDDTSINYSETESDSTEDKKGSDVAISTKTKLKTDHDTDYLFDYFINEDKFNSALRDKFNDQMKNIVSSNSDMDLLDSNDMDANSGILISGSDTESIVSPHAKQRNNSKNYQYKDDTDISIRLDSEFSALTSNSSGSGTESILAPDIKGKESISFQYKDDTYQLSVQIYDLYNHKLIKTLCNHIASLK